METTTKNDLYSDVKKFKNIVKGYNFNFPRRKDLSEEESIDRNGISLFDYRLLEGLIIDNQNNNNFKMLITDYYCFDNAYTYYVRQSVNIEKGNKVIKLEKLSAIEGSELYYIFNPFEARFDSDEKVEFFIKNAKKAFKWVEDVFEMEDVFDIEVFKFTDKERLKIWDNANMKFNTTFVLTIKQKAISKFTLYYIVKLLRIIYAQKSEVNSLEELMNGLIFTNPSAWTPAMDFKKYYKQLNTYIPTQYPLFCHDTDLNSHVKQPVKMEQYSENHKKEEILRKEKILKNELMNKYKALKEVAVKVFSRHPTHEPLRGTKTNYRILFRFGSTTTTPEKMKGRYIEINSPEAVRISSSKILMKQAFEKTLKNNEHAQWRLIQNEDQLEEFIDQFDEKTKFVLKSEFGSRNSGNILCQSKEEALSKGKNRITKKGRFIIEKYYNYSKEYRLHVTEEGCFYTCRKMVRQDTPKDKRWFRNNENSVWILEENPQFEKPSSWTDIEAACISALKATGLDVGACDVIVNKEGDFKICEINSAPSFGDLTLEKYQELIPTLINLKTKKEN